MKIYYQIIIYLILALLAFYLTTIVGFIKYYVFWLFNKEIIEFKLNKIWERKGIIEIQGGAETGKTLLIIALIIYLPGRKWSNVPNTVNGHQKLTLPTLKKHWMGQYDEGIVGSNNVLLIDEPWNFFNQEKLEAANLQSEDLTKLLWFTSETSKTDWKIFYVKKLGAEPAPPFKLLEENKSVTVRTLGLRKFTTFLKRIYYYLDIEVIQNNNQSNFGSTRYKKDKNGKWKPIRASRLGKLFTRRNKIISIPLSSEDLKVYDQSWNVDKFYAKNREISINKKMKADVLTEMMKTGQSRRQKLREEWEMINYWKKHPDKSRQKQAIIKGRQLAIEKGLHKTAEGDIAAAEALLQEQLENGEISLEDFREASKNIVERKAKLSTVISQIYPENPDEEKDSKPNKKGKKENFFTAQEGEEDSEEENG